MDWLADLLKFISASRLFAFALLCASSVLVFGPTLLPSQLEDIGAPWKNIGFACLAYSGAILIVPLSAWAWSQASNGFLYILSMLRSRNITDDERYFLEWMVHQHTGQGEINLQIAWKNDKGPNRLRYLELLKSTHAKGLTKRSVYDETIVWLTPRGRRKALEFLEAKEQVTDA